MPKTSAVKQNQTYRSLLYRGTGSCWPEVKAVLTVIARNKLVLATGHSSPQEDLLLVKEGHLLGVEHMVVTYPMSSSVRMNVAQMQEAAKAGAFIEHRNYDTGIRTPELIYWRRLWFLMSVRREFLPVS